jgi:hypothetical protein
VTFARIPGNNASGATIITVGIKGEVRGKQKHLPNGEVARPDIVVLDDPQTEQDDCNANQSECSG